MKRSGRRKKKFGEEENPVKCKIQIRGLGRRRTMRGRRWKVLGDKKEEGKIDGEGSGSQGKWKKHQ